MKKLLIVLMVLAMSSFLFVGCLPGVTPVTPVTPTPTPTTVTPIIIGVTGGAYINAAEAAAGLTVNGTAPTYSEVKVYIDGICAGTGNVLANGTWTVVIAKADLGADGAKVLYATAKETGLAESAHSNEKKFTLDVVKPKIKSSKAKAGTAVTPAVTTALLTYQTLDGTVLVPPNDTPLFTAALFDATQLLSGVVKWKIEILSISWVTEVKVRVYNLTAGTAVDYTFDNTWGPPALVTTSNSWIPGVTVTVSDSDTTFVGGLDPFTDLGAYCLITTTDTPVVAGVPGYIDVTFDEAVTSASILVPVLPGAWTAYAATNNLAPTPTVRSATVARLSEAVAGTMVVGQAYAVSCSGIVDLAGNTISATAPSTSTGIVMP